MKVGAALPCNFLLIKTILVQKHAVREVCCRGRISTVQNNPGLTVLHLLDSTQVWFDIANHLHQDHRNLDDCINLTTAQIFQEKEYLTTTMASITCFQVLLLCRNRFQRLPQLCYLNINRVQMFCNKPPG